MNQTREDQVFSVTKHADGSITTVPVNTLYVQPQQTYPIQHGYPVYPRQKHYDPLALMIIGCSCSVVGGMILAGVLNRPAPVIIPPAPRTPVQNCTTTESGWGPWYSKVKECVTS